MAKAKKLDSGNWRVLVYSHTDSVLQDDGTVKKVRRYESFTHEDEDEANYLAAEFKRSRKKKKNKGNLTVSEAMDVYISARDGMRSPGTIRGYKKIKRNHFPDLMYIKVKDITIDDLQVALNEEYKRPSKKYKNKEQPLSPKTVSNAYGFLCAVLRDCSVDLEWKRINLAEARKIIKDLPKPEVVMGAVYGTEIELAVLLAMWLSFSMSEVRGLSKSKSITGGYLVVSEVIIDDDNGPITKDIGKSYERTRKHRIPKRIQELIDALPADQEYLVALSGQAVYKRFARILKKKGVSHMTFHELRHLNASVMALLKIPEKYAMERGGWKTNKVMKKVYQHTFSDERAAVDDRMDEYFESQLESAMQHKMQHDK